MNTVRRLASLVLMGAASVGCDGNSDQQTMFEHIEFIDANRIAIHARNEPDALLGNDGSLTIGGKAVATTAAQQALLKQYVRDAFALRSHAIATGAAGVATAGKAIGSVVSGLASGDPDRISAEVDAQAQKVEAHAAEVCVDLAALHSHQQAIAAELTAFRPYATIGAQTVADCDH